MAKLFAIIILVSTLQLNLQGQPTSISPSNIQWDTINYPKSDFGWKEGSTVPNLKLVDVNNEAFMLYDILDKMVIIDFWFIACKPCVNNKKYLKQFYKQYDINIMSISIDRRASTIKRYAEENHLNWINIHDNGNINYDSNFHAHIGLGNSYPDYIVITPDKKILKIFSSGGDIGKLGVLLQEYFKKKE